MSATAKLETAGLLEAPKECQILILCEDFSTYLRASDVCRRMLEQFGNELDFDFKCWNFIELSDADCARSAMKTAGTADIILLAMHGKALSPVMDAWLATFPETRFRADGALVLVWDEPSGPADEKLFARLGQLARRSKMDFFPLLPPPVILARQDEEWPGAAPQFDHWGLNE
jgi:hypothetical protein